eukprot:scaffold264419_cov23-Tisochrysis_lutea.AAC.1
MITCGRSGEAAQFSSVLFALIGAAATVYTVLAHREYGSPAPSTISSGVFDLKEPYYRQLTPAGWWGQASAGVSQ